MIQKIYIYIMFCFFVFLSFRLLDMGFEKDVSSILNAINDQGKSSHHTVLVSATLSEGEFSLEEN